MTGQDPAIREALARLRPGSSLFLPGSTAEIPSLTRALQSGDAPPLDLTTTYVPGINPSLAGRLSEGSRLTSVFGAAPRGSQARGELDHLPLSYGLLAQRLRHAAFDTVFVTVVPPDRRGSASLGLAAEFTPLVLRRARHVIAIVNARLPALTHAPRFDLASAAQVIEVDEPLAEYDVGGETAVSSAIADRIAAFIADGAILQIGLGKVPDALLARLADRRNLRLHSGMLSDGVRVLAEAGALDPAYRQVSCVHVGTSAYYDWLAGRDDIAVAGCEDTHDPANLFALPRLVAVNSALEVDLFGQANLEMLGGRAISGVGGAIDFAQAASQSEGGLSIVALPAASSDGATTRIVPRLESIASLPRCYVDVVVTEHGAADLRGLSVVKRAAAMIDIAAPPHRAMLDAAWHSMKAAL